MPPKLQKHAAAVDIGIIKIWLQLNRTFKADECVIRPLQIGVCIAAIVESLWIVGIERERAVERIKRFLETLEMAKNNPHAVKRIDRAWVDPCGFFEEFERFLQFPILIV